MWDSVIGIAWRPMTCLNQNSITSGTDSNSAVTLYKRGGLLLAQSIRKSMLKHKWLNMSRPPSAKKKTHSACIYFHLLHALLFIGAAVLCQPLLPQRYLNSEISRGVFVSLTDSSGPYTLTCLEWVALQNVALQVTWTFKADRSRGRSKKHILFTLCLSDSKRHLDLSIAL
jgi:hypothetical protein